MSNKRTCVLVLASLVLFGCATQADEKTTMHIGVGTPEHYDVWVDEFVMRTSDGRQTKMSMGYVRCCWSGADGPKGKGGPITEIPSKISIEWYSFAENKTYEKTFSLPQNLGEKMTKPATYETSLGKFERPRDILTVGLAPGGRVVIWIQNQIGNEIEVRRLKANELQGRTDRYPDLSKSYLRKNSAYLEKHGIPTEGW